MVLSFSDSRMLDLSPFLRCVLSLATIFDVLFLKFFPIASCESLATRFTVMPFVDVDFCEFAMEVEAKEFPACNLATFLSVLFNRFLKIFVPLAHDSRWQDTRVFFRFTVEDWLPLDNLWLRFNCAADLCSFLEVDVRFEITGNVKRDGKRIDADVSRDKSWCLTCLDELLVTRGTKCRSSACSFSISSRRTRIPSILSLAISEFRRRTITSWMLFFYIRCYFPSWKFSPFTKYGRTIFSVKIIHILTLSEMRCYLLACRRLAINNLYCFYINSFADIEKIEIKKVQFNILISYIQFTVYLMRCIIQK